MIKKLLGFVILFILIGMGIASSTENIAENTSEYKITNKVVVSEELSVRGHIAYAYCSGFCPHGEGPCYFDLDNPEDIEQLSNECLPNFATGGTWTNDGRWLVCEYSNGALFDIDPETGEISTVGGGGTGLNGLAYNPLTEKLYGASSSNLYEIEITTGNQTYIGTFGTSNCMVAIAFDIDGICYGLDVKFSGDPYLYKINTSTGEATPIAPLINCSSSWILNAAFDRDNEIFYLLGVGLYICNTETGECTRVGTENLPELTGFAIPYEYQAQYIPHEPIYINGNDDFTSENGVTGGSGTSDDPYTIDNWEINASFQDGITIRNASVNFSIMNCYVHNGGINYDGIVFINVTNGVIEDTKITGNRNGIMFRTQYPGKENSENNIIRYNNIFSNTYDGIHFEHTGWGYHSNNVITHNNVSDNNRGIYLIMSAYNHIVANNIISNDEVGLKLDMCGGGGEFNKIYHNNFVNNGDYQGFEQGGPTNTWDDDYPSGGNYWCDYIGEDTNGDGIGDTPYPIPDGNNEDRYPLMEPWGGLNLPPNKPSIAGPRKVIVGVNNEFKFSAIDPDVDNVSYYINWGDGVETGWLNYVNSGTEVKLKHNWSNKGVYKIQCKAKDIFESESDISEFYVEVTKDKQISTPLWSHWFFNRFPFLQRLINIMGRYN